MRPVTSSVMPDHPEQCRHALTHVPFQSWCSVCVRAKSREDSHLQRPTWEKETIIVDEPPLVQMDFTILEGITVLTMIDVQHGYGAATKAPD